MVVQYQSPPIIQTIIENTSVIHKDFTYIDLFFLLRCLRYPSCNKEILAVKQNESFVPCSLNLSVSCTGGLLDIWWLWVRIPIAHYALELIFNSKIQSTPSVSVLMDNEFSVLYDLQRYNMTKFQDTQADHQMRWKSKF